VKWLVCFLLLTQTAQAQRVPLPLWDTSGTAIEHLGVTPVPRRDLVRQITDEGAIEIGFVYDHSGLSTIDFWRWNGRFCLYVDNHYWELTQAEAGTIMGTEVRRPFGYTWPTGLLLLLGVALVAVVASLIRRIKC